MTDETEASPNLMLGMVRTWVRSGNTTAAGSAALGGQMLDAAAIAARIDRCEPEELGGLLDRLNGHFAAAKVEKRATYAIVDHVRSIPLLLVDHAGERTITDDVESAVERRGGAGQPDAGRLAELLMTLVVTGSETLVDGVHQIEAGTFQEVPHDIRTPPTKHRWYAFRPNSGGPADGDLVEQGRATLFSALARMLAVAGDDLLAVPLSGGLDSRLLLHVLLQHDVDREQIRTFTYGRPGSQEAQIAQRVARQLGVRWEFVPYSMEGWRDLRRDSSWSHYMRAGSSLSGVPNIADLPAILHLQACGSLPENSVLLPGHTGGFLCGSWIPSLARRSHGSREDVIESVFVNHYRLRSMPMLGRLLGYSARDLSEILRARAEASVPDAGGRLTRDELVSMVEEWVWKERQAKFIVNSVRAYENLGLRWWLPWWDREVVDFWAIVPLEERLGQPLRDRIALAVGDNLGTGSWRVGFQKRAISTVRRLGVDSWAKRTRNTVKGMRPGRAYRNDPLGWHGMIDEDRFREWYTGRELGFAFLGEEVADAFFDGALKA